MTHDVRPYQLEGALFLARSPVALLADEMGVGKTFQALMATELAQCRQILVLCPPAASMVWSRQSASYLPPGRGFSVLKDQTASVPSTGGVICSYDLSITKRISTGLCSRTWDCVIADESHRLNNSAAKRSAFVWDHLRNKTKFLWCLSGTPVKNHMGELWPFLKACGAYPSGYWNFVGQYLTTRDTLYGTQITGTRADKIQALKDLIAPYMLRRLKHEVMQQLPPLHHTITPVDASPVDLKQYYHKVGCGLQSEEDLYKEINTQLSVTESLLNVIGEQNYTDAGAALSALQNSTSLSRRFVGLQKVPAIARLVRTELNDNLYQKIVLFCWHRDVIEYLRVNLREFGTVTLFGGQLLTQKDQNIMRFQRQPSTRVCIAQILAAGVAIDLTAASEVGFVECSYVPADNAQAVMRVHRYPQELPVRSRLFVLPGSVDERVSVILRKKIHDLTRIFAAAREDSKAHVPNPFE